MAIAGGSGQELQDIEAAYGYRFLDVVCYDAYIGGWGIWVDIGTVVSLSKIEATGSGISNSGMFGPGRGWGGTLWSGG